jgi:hypothetical protein
MGSGRFNGGIGGRWARSHRDYDSALIHSNTGLAHQRPLPRLLPIGQTKGMEENPKPRRRWGRFSLRTMLVATMFVAFGGAWVGMQLEQKRRHEQVVSEIVNLDGRVTFSNAWEVPAAARSNFCNFRRLHITAETVLPVLSTASAVDSKC